MRGSSSRIRFSSACRTDSPQEKSIITMSVARGELFIIILLGLIIGLRYSYESITEVNCNRNNLLLDFAEQSEEMAQIECRLVFWGCDCLVDRIVPKFALGRTGLVVQPSGGGIPIKERIDVFPGVKPAKSFIVNPKARLVSALQIEPTVVEVINPSLLFSVKITEP